jgi:hypothetical protein
MSTFDPYRSPRTGDEVSPLRGDDREVARSLALLYWATLAKMVNVLLDAGAGAVLQTQGLEGWLPPTLLWACLAMKLVVMGLGVGAGFFLVITHRSGRLQLQGFVQIAAAIFTCLFPMMNQTRGPGPAFWEPVLTSLVHAVGSTAVYIALRDLSGPGARTAIMRVTNIGLAGIWLHTVAFFLFTHAWVTLREPFVPLSGGVLTWIVICLGVGWTGLVTSLVCQLIAVIWTRADVVRFEPEEDDEAETGGMNAQQSDSGGS